MKELLSKQRSRAWCLTLNNPDAKIDKEIEAFTKQDCFQYCIYQLEEGEKRKTPHYQMYIEVKETLRGSAIKKFFPTAHIEKRRGSQNQAIAYCQKAESRKGSIIVYGKPSVQGARNDLQELVAMLDKHSTWNECIRDATIHPQLAKYGSFAKEYFNSKKSKRDGLRMLHRWQEELLEVIKGEPDNRTVTWYVDVEGGKGKSEMTKELITQHDAIVMGGRGATDLYQYAQSKNKIVIWDFPRDMQMHEPYDAIEKIKDGYYTSTFRNPMFCQRDYPAHIIIFANYKPDESKLSADRWKIIELTDDDCDPYLKFS
jgi:hypothetical protein|tara:strand:- start:812 stop:1753 length:942 start_codon:yes stop_codon:yes gene_type:complete